MKHTITSSFQLNTEKLFCKTISRSLLQNWHRKLLFVTTLNSKRLDMTKTTYIYFATFLRNTVVAMWCEFSKALLPENYLRIFLAPKKTPGEGILERWVFTFHHIPTG